MPTTTADETEAKLAQSKRKLDKLAKLISEYRKEADKLERKFEDELSRFRELNRIGYDRGTRSQG